TVALNDKAFGPHSRSGRGANELQTGPSRHLRDRFRHYHVGAEFAVKLLRRFRARTSIWNVEPNLRRLVWRVAQSARYRARHSASRFRHSLFNLSSSPTHLVDLGDHLRNYPYYVSQHHGSGFHRTAF